MGVAAAAAAVGGGKGGGDGGGGGGEGGGGGVGGGKDVGDGRDDANGKYHGLDFDWVEMEEELDCLFPSRMQKPQAHLYSPRKRLVMQGIPGEEDAAAVLEKLRRDAHQAMTVVRAGGQVDAPETVKQKIIGPKPHAAPPDGSFGKSQSPCPRHEHPTP